MGIEARQEISPAMLTGITALAPLSGEPGGGAIAALKQNFGIPDAKPGADLGELIKPAVSQPARSAPGVS